MKKCDFCAKEISYYDQYCNEECEQKALRYYAMVERYAKLFMIVNTIHRLALRSHRLSRGGGVLLCDGRTAYRPAVPDREHDKKA